MKISTRRIALPAGIAIIALLGWRSCRNGGPQAETVREVTRGRIEVWTAIDGYLEARNVRQVMSQLSGPATLVEIVPDGAQAAQGETLVRFDSAQLERDVLKLERDHSLAREEMNTLVNARLPMELRDIELRLSEARERCDDEAQLLEDNNELVREGLLAESDLKSQAGRLESAKTAAESLEQQVELTKKYVHPSMLERARATLNSAEQELDLARRQLSNCTIRAAAAGMVGYRPIAIAGEFRTVRVGDTVFKNQPFMTLSDMTNLVLYCDVPEAELTRYAPGCPAGVSPVAFPDLDIEARVEAISSSARTLPGRGGGQKYFTVTVRLETSDPRLRSGMSARARVLSYSRDDAVLVPRTAVTWEGATPWCRVKRIGGTKKTKLALKMADERNYEAVGGVAPGDKVLVE